MSDRTTRQQEYGKLEQYKVDGLDFPAAMVVVSLSDRLVSPASAAIIQKLRKEVDVCLAETDVSHPSLPGSR